MKKTALLIFLIMSITLSDSIGQSILNCEDEPGDPKYGLIDKKGRELLPCIYPYMERLGNGFYVFSNEVTLATDEYGFAGWFEPGLLGIVTARKVEAENTYERVVLNGKNVIAEKGGSLFLVNKKLKTKPLPYTYLRTTSSGFIFSEADGYGFMDAKLKKKTDATYDEVIALDEIQSPALEEDEDIWGWDDWGDDSGDDSWSDDPWGDDVEEVVDPSQEPIIDQDVSSANLYVVKKEGKAGLVNVETFEQVLNLEYDNIYPLQIAANQFLVITINEKQQLFNADTYQPISTETFDLITTLGGNILTQVGEKFQLRDLDLNELLPGSFDEISIIDPYEDEYSVWDDEFWGDPFGDGSFEDTEELTSDEDESKSNDYYRVRVSDKVGIYDSTFQEVLPVEYDEFYSGFSDSFIRFKKDNLFGLMDKEFQIVLDAEYDELYSYQDEKYLAVKKGDKYGMLETRDFEEILPFVYDNLEEDNSGLIIMNNLQEGLLSWEDFEEILPSKYAKIISSQVGLLVQKGGLWGIFSREKKEFILPIEFEDYDFIGNYFVGMKKNKTTLHHLDSLDKPSEEYAFTDFISNSDNPIVKLSTGYGLVTVDEDNYSKLNIILEPKYDSIIKGDYYSGNGGTSDQYLIMMKDGKYSIVSNDEELQPLLPGEFDLIEELGYSLDGYSIKKGDSMYVYQTANSELRYLGNYDRIVPGYVVYDYVRMTKNGKVGLFNKEDFSVVVEAEYDFITPGAALYKGNKKWILDRETKSLIPVQSDIDLKINWIANTGWATYRSSIMEENGSVYLGTNGQERTIFDNEDTYDGFYAINARSGKVIYTKQHSPLLETDTDYNGIAIADGNIVIAKDIEEIESRSKDGELNWTLELHENVEGSPVVADANGDGTNEVFALDRYSNLYSIQLDSGIVNWIHDLDGYSVMTSPVVADLNNDKALELIVAVDKSLMVFDATSGDLKKSMEIGEVKSTPLVFEENSSVIVLFSTLDGKIGEYDFVNDKLSIEIINEDGGFYSSPIITPDKDIVVQPVSYEGIGGKVVFYNRKTGDTKTYNKEEAFSATPLIADILGNGTQQIIVAGEGGTLAIFDGKGELLKEYNLLAGPEATPLIKDIDRDGYLELIISDHDGRLTCYQTRSKGKVTWGQFRGNNTNSLTK